MPRHTKTPIQKLETKINNVIIRNPELINSNNKIKLRNKVLFKYDIEKIEYYKKRYYPTKKEDISNESYNVTIPLNHENLDILSYNIYNPPAESKDIITYFEKYFGSCIDKLVLGGNENKVANSIIYIKKDLYEIIKKIKKEETIKKANSVVERTMPLITSSFNVDFNLDEINTKKDYSLMLQEVLKSGEFTQQDLLSLSNELQKGETNKIVIENQIKKQVSWLIDTIQEIIDEPNITVPKAKEVGQKYFNFRKIDILGEESLMEKILSEYGKNTFFGVPELLNTKKYVKNAVGLPRCQFDIVLINYLNDIEVVELKRPSQHVLDYDPHRNKFYPSKDLSIAISQAERYITTFNKSNDNEYTIDGKTIKEYVKSHFGGAFEIDVCRPSALIIIGTKQTLTKAYDSLSDKQKKTLSKYDYDKNGLQAYNEIKNSFRNINILTYTELLENARLRLGT